MMLWLALIVLVSWKLGQKRSALSRETSRRQSLANGVIVDSLANYSEIKSFANFRFERLNLIKHLRILRRAENVEQKAKAWIHLAQNLLRLCLCSVSCFFQYGFSAVAQSTRPASFMPILCLR